MGDTAVCAETGADWAMNMECSSKTKGKRDCELLIDAVEAHSFPNKKPAKDEALNEDIKSEVSNPVGSPKEFASSFQDITSQKTEVITVNQSKCNELPSISYGNFSSEETLSDGEGHTESANALTSGNDMNPADVSKSHVVLEIPKHVTSYSGIRKITFKFSKKKEDYVAPVAYEEGRNYSVYDDLSSPQGSNRILCTQNMEIKMSKKVVPSEYPTNVKKLLSTGILNGASVKYICTSQERELDGIISGCGYLCGCPSCNLSKVLSAHEFEQHAGAKTRHPNNHIYLENGKPIYSIIQELKTAPPGVLEEVVKNVAGSSFNEGSFQVWKASLHPCKGMVEQDGKHYMKHPTLPHSVVSCSSLALEESISPTSCSFVQDTGREQQTYMKEMLEERKRAVKRPLAQQKKTTEGGTKKRDNDLHRLLFLPNGLSDGETLTYIVKGQRLRSGHKQGNGIFCDCCNKEISPSQFEAHAGMAARRQPYRHIYTSNGVTLHDIAISLALGQRRTAGSSDDMCHVCGDGENLLFCKSCPLAFHAACVDTKLITDSGWQCPDCRAGQSSSLSRSVDLKGGLEAPGAEVGGCVICRRHDFSSAKFDDRTVIYCDQCEKEFHVGCLRDRELCDLKEIPKDKWFCCDDCNRIHKSLQDFVSNGAQTIPASSLCTINRKHIEKGISFDGAMDVVQWQILKKSQLSGDEEKSQLSSTTAIFRECFDPIIAESGRDLIPVMVYGRNISGQEFGGMYSIILTVKFVVVSAGLLRIFGREVAELPLVATCREYQGKGCFQALFSCIERLLCSLKVENLVLPAAEKAESIWTKKFGFRKMSKERLLKYQKDYQLTVFRGTSMLEKKLQCQPE